MNIPEAITAHEVRIDQLKQMRIDAQCSANAYPSYSSLSNYNVLVGIDEEIKVVENVLRTLSRFEMWVDALRSGEYKQSTGQLYDGEGFCCIGVFAKHLNLAEVLEHEWKGLGMNFGGHFEVDTLPENVASEHNVRVDFVFDRMMISEAWKDQIGSSECLIDLNDSVKMSFEEIADFIEQNPMALIKV